MDAEVEAPPVKKTLPPAPPVLEPACSSTGDAAPSPALDADRSVTAPASPLGQRFYVDSPYATDVTAPTTIAPDPTRNPQRTDRPENDEPVIDGIYAYVYATDLELGLILVGAGTVLDGNPTNNFLEPALVYNPDGVLNGARSITIVGEYAYICCEAGLVTVDLADPLQPRITNVMEHELHHPHDVTASAGVARGADPCSASGPSFLPCWPSPPPLVVCPCLSFRPCLRRGRGGWKGGSRAPSAAALPP